MDQRTLEIEITYYRRKYELNQEDICNGICSLSKLSRLEKGYREMDSLVGESLLGRIGKEITVFEILLNEEDYDLWKRREKIRTYVESNEFEKAEKCIEEYRKIIPPDETVHEQFCMYEEAIMMLRREEPADLLCQTLENGIKLTIPDFGKDKDKIRLYNQTEIEMILLLFHYDLRSADFLEKELLKILAHVKKYFSIRKKEEIGIKIYFELMEHSQAAGNNEKVLEYIEEAINLIREGRGFRFLSQLFFMKAKVIRNLYSHKTEWDSYKEECMEACKIAYYLFEFEEDRTGQSETAGFYEEEFGCQITEPEISSD